MFHRTFEGNPPYLTFTGDGRQEAFGNFVPGQRVTLRYDAARLPQERSTVDGRPAWSITAFYQFAPQGAVQSKQLEMPAGPPPVRHSSEAVEATFLSTTIDVPDDASEVILWFLNSGRSGMQFWDSNGGANYVFRFTALDIQGEEANVVSTADTPYGAFHVSMWALPAVESAMVTYRVANAPAEAPFDGSVALTAGEVANGRRRWSASGVVVPAGARVRFAFRYTVGGRTFVDDNDGTGFWAPKPLPTHDPRKFLAALAARGGA